MSKSTRIDINYRLPAQCCWRCDRASLNMYGDLTCALLHSTDLITPGAICDKYQGKGIVVTEHKDIEVKTDAVVTINCIACKHSYMNGDKPVCDIDNRIIEDTSGTCGAAELAE